MKKIILALATVALISLGGVPAHAQDDGPVDCADQPSSDPADPCYNPVLYPPTTPQTSVGPPTTTTIPGTTTTSEHSGSPTVPQSTESPVSPPNNLPQTGSGISSVLGIGALLLLGGGLIVVASRRRSTASNPAS